MATDLQVDDPVLPRQRKRPRRYEGGEGEEYFPEKVEDFYRAIYFEALDVVSGIKECFDQPGYKLYSKLKDLLLKAANKQEHKEELKVVTDF